MSELGRPALASGHYSCTKRNKVLPLFIAVCLALLIVTPVLAQTPTTVYTTRSVFMRAGAGMSWHVVATLPGGEQLSVIETSGIWYHVKRADGSEGWVSGSFLMTNPPGSGGGTGVAAEPLVPKPPTENTLAVVNSPVLNIRSGPGLNFKVVGTAQGGEVILILAREAQWRLIHTASGVQGWVNGFYLTSSITPPLDLNLDLIVGPGSGQTGGGAALGGPLAIRQIAFDHAVRDPSRPDGAIVTVRVEFTGGASPYQVTSDGFAKTGCVCPGTRLEGSTVVATLLFTDLALCGGTMVHSVTLLSADGQSATKDYYISPVVCPNG